MSDFYSLSEPQFDTFIGLWFVLAEKCAGKSQVLNNHNEVVILGLRTEGMYFKREHEAHKAAYMYYMNHYIPYPYTGKWLSCSGKKPIVTATQTIESQVMRFK